MTKDNEFGENELIRTLEIQKDIMISCLGFHDQMKCIIVGTNNGVLQFFESDTGKKGPSYSEPVHQTVEITNIILIPDIKEFVITTDSLGRINFIALPPLNLAKDNKIFMITNTNPDMEKTEAGIQITSAIYCEANQQLFISDDCVIITHPMPTLPTPLQLIYIGIH